MSNEEILENIFSNPAGTDWYKPVLAAMQLARADERENRWISVEEAGVIAVNISSMITPKLTWQEEAMIIAGFQECIKYLKLKPLPSAPTPPKQ